MQNRRRPTQQGRQKEPAMVRQLLYEWNHLFIAEDGILYHTSGSRIKWCCPGSITRVYEKLHENMGYLGADRVMELARTVSIDLLCGRTSPIISQKCAGA